MPRDHVYDRILLVLTGMLVVGFICNVLIRPVAPKWFMKPEEVAALQDKQRVAGAVGSGSFGIGRGGLSLGTALAWAAVGLPLAWGVLVTLQKAFVLFS
jgi:hypothetical protein